MAKIKTRPWDVANYLETEKDIQAYMEACIAEDAGDGSLIRTALGDIARVRGMSKIARDTGVGREHLYKALSAEGNPEFSTVLKVMKALGLHFHITGATAA